MVIDFDGLIELVKMGVMGILVTSIVVLTTFIVLSIISNWQRQETNSDRHRQAIKRLENLTKAVRNHGA